MQKTLETNLSDIVTRAILHAPPARALVIYDRRSELSRLLADAYRVVLPEAGMVDFDACSHAEVLARIDEYAAGDLVVMVESTRFDLREFRFRLELFRRKLRVIEHPHLGRMPGEEVAIYIDSLAYDPDYVRGTGRSLKGRLDRASEVRVVSPGGTLAYRGPFEDAKLNIGDYSAMTNIGGQFPIGEVFTEPVDLSGVDGVATIFAFGDSNFAVNVPDPRFSIRVEGGRVTGAPGATPDFEEVLDAIRAGEGEVIIRELGLGLNRAFTPERRVSDVGSYERMCGVHLSLGAKHAVYTKAGFERSRARFHVDVFVALERMEIDDEVVFSGGAWQR